MKRHAIAFSILVCGLALLQQTRSDEAPDAEAVTKQPDQGISTSRFPSASHGEKDFMRLFLDWKTQHAGAWATLVPDADETAPAPFVLMYHHSTITESGNLPHELH